MDRDRYNSWLKTLKDIDEKMLRCKSHRDCLLKKIKRYEKELKKK